MGLVALVLALVGGALALRHDDSIEVTAHFPEVKGVYVGDDVTYRGVPVGVITSIHPGVDDVVVEMRLDPDVRLPADLEAAIAAPALVSVRSIAVGPPYRGGPLLRPGTVIPLERTSVPVEWDQVKAQLTEVSRALGPQGADRTGAIGDLVDAGAGFLDGNGLRLRQTFHRIAALFGTLAGHRDTLFATVRNLDTFTAALDSGDTDLRGFAAAVDEVLAALDSQRGELGRALRGLRTSFADLRAFLDQNRDLSASTARRLGSVTQVFADSRQRLADLLQVAPTTLSNFYNILDPRVGAITGVLAAQNLKAPAQIVCTALLNLGGKPEECLRIFGPLVDALATDAPPTGDLPLPAPSGGAVPGLPTVPLPPAVSELLDGPRGLLPLLGGLFGGGAR